MYIILFTFQTFIQNNLILLFFIFIYLPLCKFNYIIMSNTIPVHFKLSPEYKGKLDKITDHHNRDRSRQFRQWIDDEYNLIFGE